jgi:transposase
MVAAIGNGAAFHKGLEFAAWLGLIPKQYSTGCNASRLTGLQKLPHQVCRGEQQG